MKRLIISGSPRTNGRSAKLAEMLFEANIDERPEDELFLVPVSEVEIGPCIGCGACRKQTEITFCGDDGQETTELRHRCIFDDDMQGIYDLLDEIDELTIVSPVYFSGAPAPMKCVLDRMQPYFWVNQWGRDKSLPPEFADVAGTRLKRPATLHVVGEGGDPYGFAPLVNEVSSSLACAGFRLERVFDWVGRIDESGEILADAQEVDPEVVRGAVRVEASHEKGAKGAGAAGAGAAAADMPREAPRNERAASRPKLDLSASKSSQKDNDSRGKSGGARKKPGASNTRSKKSAGKGKRRG